MSFEKEFTESWGKLQEENTPGNAEMAQIKASQAEVRRKESDIEADKAWRETGYQAPYDHRQAFADGVDFKKELPNKYVTPKKVNLSGFDLSSGRLYFPVTGDEQAQALVREGAEGISKSGRTPGKEPPDRDVLPLSRVAQGHAASGGSFDDFNLSVEAMEYNEKQRKIAWQAGVDARNMAFTLDHFKRLESVRSMTHTDSTGQEQASRPFAETLADPKFIGAGRKIWEALNNDKFTGSDADAARWLADHFRDINFNTVMQAVSVGRMRMAAQDVSREYMQAMEMFENTDMEPSWREQFINLGRGAWDPINWIGAGAGRGGMLLMTAGWKAIKDVSKRFAVGGAAGGAISGASTELTEASLQGRNVDPAKMGLNVAGGAAVSGAISTLGPEAAALGKAAIAKAIKNYLEAPSSGPPGSLRAQRGMLSFGGGIPSALIIRAPFDPVSGLYSPTQRAALELPDVLPADQMIKALKGKLGEAHGIRKEELDFLGLEEAFPGNAPLKREDMLKYIDETRPQLEVQIRSRTIESQYERAYRAYLASPEASQHSEMEMGLVQQMATLPVNSPERLRLEGEMAQLENARNARLEFYRQHLPTSDIPNFELEGYTLGSYGTRPESNFRNVLFFTRKSGYVGPHMQSTPGTVMWYSTTDRQMPDGRVTLHIEEVQSDMLQAYKEAKRFFDKNQAQTAKENPGYVPKDFNQHLWGQYHNFKQDKTLRDAGDFRTELRSIVSRIDWAADVDPITRAREVTDLIRDLAEPRGPGIMPEWLMDADEKFNRALAIHEDNVTLALARGADPSPASTARVANAARELNEAVQNYAKPDAPGLPGLGLAMQLPVSYKDAKPSQVREFLADQDFWKQLPRQPTDKSPSGKKVEMAYGKKTFENAVRLALFDAAASDKDMLTWAHSSELRKRYPAQGSGLIFEAGPASVRMDTTSDRLVVRGSNELKQGATDERKYSRADFLAKFKDALSPEDAKKVEDLGKKVDPTTVNFGGGGFEYAGRPFQGKWAISKDGANYMFHKITAAGGIELTRSFTDRQYKELLGSLALGDDRLLAVADKLRRWERDLKTSAPIRLSKKLELETPPFRSSYDEEMKNEVNKFLKAIGMEKETEVKLIDMPVVPGSHTKQKVWSLEITPKMREYLKKRGISLAMKGEDGVQAA